MNIEFSEGYKQKAKEKAEKLEDSLSSATQSKLHLINLVPPDSHDKEKKYHIDGEVRFMVDNLLVDLELNYQINKDNDPNLIQDMYLIESTLLKILRRKFNL